MLNTYWVCVNHRWGSPPAPCGARGTGDTKADAHTQRHPHHPTFTTTREDLAEQLAGPVPDTADQPAPVCDHDQCGNPGELLGETVLCPSHVEERP